MTEMAIIADDLTGACDTALQSAAQGPAAVVVLKFETAQRYVNYRWLALNTESRHLPPLDAARRVEEAARAISLLAPQRVYKKIDSTMKGNAGAEIESALTGLGRTFALIAPAFPANGRTVRDGVLHVRGEAASSIPETLGAQTGLPILTLPPLNPMTLAETASRIARETGAPRLYVVDAERDEHLDALVSLIELLPDALPAGSAGLAAAMARRWERGRRARNRPEPRAPGSRVLLLAGSMNPATHRQLDRLREEMDACLVDAGGSDGPAIDRVVAALDHRGICVVQSPRDARPATRAGDWAGILGEIGAAVLRSTDAAVVLTGGDVAQAFADRAGVEAIEILDEVEPGIPAGRLLGGALSGRPVVTKAGGFGGEDALLRAVWKLKGYESR